MIFRKLISVITAFAMLITSVSFLAATAESAEPSVGFTAEDFLTTKGRKIVNQKGEKITLKGVNLGSWMIWEDWLCPYEEATDHYDVLTKLTERFGEEKAYELMNTYMDNWITEKTLTKSRKWASTACACPSGSEISIMTITAERFLTKTENGISADLNGLLRNARSADFTLCSICTVPSDIRAMLPTAVRRAPAVFTMIPSRAKDTESLPMSSGERLQPVSRAILPLQCMTFLTSLCARCPAESLTAEKQQLYL